MTAALPRQLRVQTIPLDRLHPAPWNANIVPRDTLAKIRRSMVDFGIVENLVARHLPNPCPVCGGTDHLEVVSGNHRLEILHELGAARASVHALELDDARAMILAQTLNRTRGQDDPARYAELLEQVVAELGVQTVTAYLPETERSIDKIIGDTIRADANFATMPRPGKPKSRRGEIYELGPHRLMCGDATSATDVEQLLAGDEPILTLADPPYGVSLDMDWRRGGNRHPGGRILTHAPAKYARATGVMNDDRIDWGPAFALVPSIRVAYVWHATSLGPRVAAGLEAVGLHIVQLIIWDKGAFVLGRNRYQWQHEAAWYAANTSQGEVPWYAPRHVPAFYARRRGSGEPWLGGHDQTTVWLAASPRLRGPNAAAEDEGVDHPTQKPVEIYTRPIKNHLEQGEPVYDPFAGSGTSIIAAELTKRTAIAMELDPRFCDVIRQRYADFTERPELAP